MEEKLETLSEIWYLIKYRVQVLVDKITKVTKLAVEDVHILSRINVPMVEQRRCSIQLVQWSKPSPGRVKLNVDGSSMGNLCNGGGVGVIQDSSGALIVAFAKFFLSLFQHRS